MIGQFLKDGSGRRTIKNLYFIIKDYKELTEADQIRPESPDSNHITQNSKPDTPQKFGVREHVTYYMRHVITFKCFIEPKSYLCEVTHNL